MTLCVHTWDVWEYGKFTGMHAVCANPALPGSDYCADHGKPCCACNTVMFADPVFPENSTCEECRDPVGVVDSSALPGDVELQRVNHELDCGIAGVLPY